MFTSMILRRSLPQSRNSLLASISALTSHDVPREIRSSSSPRGYATMPQRCYPQTTCPNIFGCNNNYKQSIRTKFTPSSYSSIPPDEEEKEYERVAALSDYQKEMELRKLDAEIARLQTLRGINTGDLYTLRGKYKILARDYGMGFMAWYGAVWVTTAGLTYAAFELGGVDPIMVMTKAETWLSLEHGAITGKVDPNLGQLGLVLVINELLEPLRLTFVVMTTRTVVDTFQKR